MKVVFCFFSALALASAFVTPVRNIGSIDDSVNTYIDMESYDSETYTVRTEDGYILDLVRIPRGRQTIDPDVPDKDLKRTVLLMPGLMATYENFVIGGSSDGLAFRLADEGYDVFMGNVRGSFYGQKHTHLNPERDVAFWRYTIHEIATKDLPAIIDKVLDVSGRSKIDYIGHMEGSTIYYMMAAEKTTYNYKINRMISLGPVAYMKRSNNEFLREIDRRMKDQEHSIESSPTQKKSQIWASHWMQSLLGLNSYSWSNDLIQTVENKCVRQGYEASVCNNIYFLVNGYNSRNYNKTTISKLNSRIPSPVSSSQILHFVQLMISGSFERYDKFMDRTKQSQEHKYDLSKVDTPVVILYSSQDTWSQPEDVKRLISELPNVVDSQVISACDNNIDMLFHINVRSRVYENIVRFLDSNPMNRLRMDTERMVHNVNYDYRRRYSEENY